MFNNMLKDKKSERLGLLLAAIIFASVAIVQLWRAIAGISVEVDGYSIPIWFSVVVGAATLVMSFWMGVILRHHS